MKELEFLKRILPLAYSRCCENGIEVSAKAEFDVVTNVDKAIELFFAEELKKEFPDDALLGEEFSSQQEALGRTWILDPIDGTYNFSIGSPLFGVQGALMERSSLPSSICQNSVSFTRQPRAAAHFAMVFVFPSATARSPTVLFPWEIGRIPSPLWRGSSPV